MSKPSWLWFIGGFWFLAFSLSYGETGILEQDFDTIPEGFAGRFGSVSPGPNPYGIEGRWSEFGTEQGTPRISSVEKREGQVVLLSRVEEGSHHPLIGSFNPLKGVSRVRMECDIWLTRESALVVSLNDRNTQAASVLLRTQAPGTALWNPRDGGWEVIKDRAPAEQWLRLTIDCDFDKASYQVTLAEEGGRELVSSEGLLKPDALDEEGLNNILFNPQPGSSEDSRVDRVILTAWP